MQNINPHLEGVYRLVRAKQPLPLIFDSAHSGRQYPLDFDYSCDSDTIRRGEDNHLDELLEKTPTYGATLLCAEFPRTYIDANRAPDDIEPEILSEPWPTPLNPTDRAKTGIGLIRRYIRPGIFVYDRKLNVNEITQRLEKYYKPYHAVLKTLLDEAFDRYDQVWHIDWHSMPSLGAITPFPRVGKRAQGGQADFVLGDRNGTSCWPEFTYDVRDFLKNLGYGVSINTPYKGVELVRRYSNPEIGRYSLQIEINKGLYWDERKITKNKNFNSLKTDIEKFTQFMNGYVSERLISRAAD